jgi:lipopolysaccharide/colanic/teichoic acid biosynthesis glycosyltransferase
MSMVAEPSRAGAAPLTVHEGGCLWGVTAGELHDRFWASRGVQAVRRGASRVDPDGPDVYLLMTNRAMMIFDPRKAVKRLMWLRASAVRLRVHDGSQQAYIETVRFAEGSEVASIERRYAMRGRSASRAWLTTDRHIAQAWASLPDGPSPWIELRRVLAERSGGRDVLPPAWTEGLVFDRTTAEGRRRFVRALLKRWPDPEALFPGSYLWDRGVVAHETSIIEEGAKLIGPVWVGAGVTVERGSVVVGPALLPDMIEAPGPGKIDWSATILPDFPLLPRLGRTPVRRVSKRAFDIAFSLLAILITLPVYPIAALLILLEDGWPVHFAHTRQTRGGVDFPCLKFRTMRKDAEAIKAKLIAQNQVDGPQFWIDNDPRVLRCGRVMRKFQIDELPQFFNVLAGHMSVVGPRPSPDKENQFCPAWREARLSVRPGITGLWQVKRTREPETDFQEWIRYDLEYVQRESWRLDVWIIVQTIKNLLLRKT